MFSSTMVVVVFPNDSENWDAFLVVVTFVPVALASWRSGTSKAPPPILWVSEGSGAVLALGTSCSVTISRASPATATASFVAPYSPLSPRCPTSRLWLVTLSRQC